MLCICLVTYLWYCIEVPMFNLFRWLFNMLEYIYMFHTTLFLNYYLHLHLHWGDTDLSFVAICKSSLNQYVYNNVSDAANAMSYFCIRDGGRCILYTELELLEVYDIRLFFKTWYCCSMPSILKLLHFYNIIMCESWITFYVDLLWHHAGYDIIKFKCPITLTF